MDTLTLLKKLNASKNEYADALLADLTEESLNWAPPGTANSIGVTLLHLAGGDDFFIVCTLQNQPSSWTAEGWDAKIGLASPPGGSPETWQAARSAWLPLEHVLACYQAGAAATNAYLEQLTDADLDRTVTLFGHSSTVGDILIMIFNHAIGHLGEIAALKGIQGMKGLPY